MSLKIEPGMSVIVGDKHAVSENYSPAVGYPGKVVRIATENRVIVAVDRSAGLASGNWFINSNDLIPANNEVLISNLTDYE
jgi:hypothetical protein